MSKVLHVSDAPLPDERVERMAYLSKKKNWKTFFAGPGFSDFALGNRVFEDLYYVPWNSYARIGLEPHFHWVRRKLKKIVDMIKPDIIHAHNLFSAKMICNFGHSFVFDDHELASFERRSDVEWEHSSLVDKIAGRYEVWRWGIWEREISSIVTVITVSESIAEHYHDLGAKTYIVPNYPSEYELSKANFSGKKDKKFTAMYLGKDISSSPRPYRDVSRIVDVFKEVGIRFVVIGDTKLHSGGPIISLGYIPHMKLYNMMSRYHVGLLPWKKHWFHKYANPNKPYMYAHSGMVVVVTSSLRNVVRAFDGKVRTIEDYSDLKETLLRLSQDMDMVLKEGKDNKEYALNNLVFERHENELMEAYKKAV